MDLDLIQQETEAAPEVDLYERLSRPAHRLQRWMVRRRRPVGRAVIQEVAYAMLAAFGGILAAPALQIEVHVRDGGEPGREDLDGLNALLDSLRRCRNEMTGEASASLRRALHSQAPGLAQDYEDKHGQVITRLGEIEAYLVLMGAGTEADAELGAHLIPMPADLPAGPSVKLHS